MTQKLFVTTALPYANAAFHIGHMMEYIQADIWVRFQRMRGARGELRLRRRRARRADHDRRREGGQDAAGVRGRDRRRPQAVPRRLSHRLRQLALDRRAGEPRAGARDLPRAAQERADRRAHDRAVLRPGEGHVPARPLHQGRVPELRHQGPVRRQLRELRRRLCAHRPEAPVLGADAAPSPSCASSEHYFFRLSDPRCVDYLQELDAGRQAADRGGQQGQGVVRRRRRRQDRARRLGHQPRRAVLRHRDPRRAGQVLLRLARRAGGLPGVAEEPVRPARRRLRCLPGRPRVAPGALHRQGHRHLPHAVLAGDAALQRAARCPTTSTCTASSRSAATR